MVPRRVGGGPGHVRVSASHFTITILSFPPTELGMTAAIPSRAPSLSLSLSHCLPSRAAPMYIPRTRQIMRPPLSWLKCNQTMEGCLHTPAPPENDLLRDCRGGELYLAACASEPGSLLTHAPPLPSRLVPKRSGPKYAVCQLRIQNTTT
ncbi:hypothetical protein LX32DRAFT_169904 [Colletotrichum zoysiae]|uniref:Uncharacterized protein n=1 Tax=Colletotrichum zoysiae TaxID=1216348 RepID=A0AAD9HRR0_9PEZI|nr:hypothetical protein LX32DRAFT_169904 [Colletotrichum zoysiae]